MCNRQSGVSLGQDDRDKKKKNETPKPQKGENGEKGQFALKGGKIKPKKHYFSNGFRYSRAQFCRNNNIFWSKLLVGVQKNHFFLGALL